MWITRTAQSCEGFITLSKLSEKMPTTCAAEAVGQYSATGWMPFGYCHMVRRISARPAQREMPKNGSSAL